MWANVSVCVSVCVCSFNHFSLLSLGHGTVFDVVISITNTHCKTYKLISFEFLFRKERFVASACISRTIARAIACFSAIPFFVDVFGTTIQLLFPWVIWLFLPQRENSVVFSHHKILSNVSWTEHLKCLGFNSMTFTNHCFVCWNIPVLKLPKKKHSTRACPFVIRIPWGYTVAGYERHVIYR